MSWFLDYCFYENAIFGRWLPWLAKKIVKRFYRSDWNRLSDPIYSENQEMFDASIIKICENYFIFKILGGCLICSNVWQSMVTFNVVFWITWCSGYVDGWWYLSILPYIFFSSFIVRKISKND